MKNFYESNSDFRDYVDRFCKTYEVSVDEALQHASVREAEKYYREKEKAENENKCNVGQGS